MPNPNLRSPTRSEQEKHPEGVQGTHQGQGHANAGHANHPGHQGQGQKGHGPPGPPHGQAQQQPPAAKDGVPPKGVYLSEKSGSMTQFSKYGS